MKCVRSGPRNSFRRLLIDFLLEKSLRGKRVLDAGCGAASLTLAFAARGARVWAVDIDQAWCT